ncbi:MAG: hypothetical protein HWN79_13465 [Candidatus Lokiarchaeota archaeon]|nr:hypothetical protein [Candidatus Lokiarchaeota archaeon]
MVNCLFCHNPVTENQVLCLNCGSQIKPLEVKHRFFWRKRDVFLSNQQPFLFENNVLEGKKREIKRRLRKPIGNMTLDRWL